MLFVPYSSMMPTMFWRMPVRSDATRITTITPMTMPSTVKKLLNLCARRLSNAISKISLGKNPGSLKRILSLLPRQRDDRVEPGRFEGRVNSGDDADGARKEDR